MNADVDHYILETYDNDNCNGTAKEDTITESTLPSAKPLTSIIVLYPILYPIPEATEPQQKSYRVYAVSNNRAGKKNDCSSLTLPKYTTPPQDTTPPVITLITSNPPAFTIHSTEAGTLTDDCTNAAPAAITAGETPISFTSLQDGTHTCTVTVVDAAENKGTLTLPEFTVDATSPVITLEGDSTITLTQGGTFTDPGATADGGEAVTVTITDAAGNVLNAVNTNTPGTYTLTYTATNAAGNIGIVTREVIINKRVGVYLSELVGYISKRTSNLRFDKDTNTLHWDAVPDADTYYVEVFGGAACNMLPASVSDFALEYWKDNSANPYRVRFLNRSGKDAVLLKWLYPQLDCNRFGRGGRPAPITDGHGSTHPPGSFRVHLNDENGPAASGCTVFTGDKDDSTKNILALPAPLHLFRKVPENKLLKPDAVEFPFSFRVNRSYCLTVHDTDGNTSYLDFANGGIPYGIKLDPVTRELSVKGGITKIGQQEGAVRVYCHRRRGCVGTVDTRPIAAGTTEKIRGVCVY